MTDKEKLEAIRAEIHRLVDVRGYDREMANDLFAFMDSLSNEPVSDGLEEAAFDYAESCKYDGGEKLLCVEHFKAGAEWGKKQAMAEIQAQSIAFAHGCLEEPVNEELVETAKSYVETHVFGTEKFTCQVATDMFISGAQWQKQQTISKACKWIEERAARYLVDRFVDSMRITGIDTSIIEDFRKAMEE